MNIANLWVTLGARTSGLLASLGEAGRIIATFSANTKVQLAQVQAGFRAFNDVSRLALAAGAFTLLAGAVALSVKPAMEFESAFAHVLRTVEGTPAQLTEIRSGILQMSREMPESAKSIAEVAATAGQLGIATPYVLEFTKTMIMLGTATNLSAEQAAIGFSRLMTIMNIAPQEVGLLGAAITQLGNNSATTESEILTVALRLGAAAKIFGFTGEQTLALSAGLRSLGIQSQVAGSSMSRVLLDMSAAAQTGGPKLEAFARVAGMTGSAFGALVTSGDPQKAQQALLAFSDGLTRIQLSGGNIVAVLKGLGFNTIQLRQTLLSIATSNGQLSRSFDLVADKASYASALTAEYARQAGTTASVLTVLKNKFTALAIDTGTPLLGGIKRGADEAGRALIALEPALRGLGQLTSSAFSELGRGVAGIVGYFGGLIDASATAHGALYVLQQTALGLAAGINRLPAPITAAALALLVFWRNGTLATAAAQAMSAAAAFSSVTIASFNANLIGNTAPRAAALTFAETGRELAGVGLSALASIGPAIALTASMYSLSRSMGDVAKAAAEIKDNELKALTSSLDTGSIDDYNTQLATLRQNVASQEWTKFDTIGFYAQGLAKYLTLGNAPDNLLKAKANYEGMAQALAEADKNAAATNINNLATQWGVGADVIQQAAQKIGATEALAKLTPDSAGFKRAVDAIQGEVKRMQEAAKSAGVSVDSFAQSGTGSVEQLAKSWKVSVAVIEDAAAKAKVDTNDLLDPKKAPEALAKISAFVAEWQLLARTIGVSTDKIHDQIAAVDQLTGSMSDLGKAMKGVGDARDAVNFQPKGVSEATQKLADAKKEFSSGKISIKELGDAYGDLVTAFAGSGVDYQTATKFQEKLGDEFLKTADKAKVSKSTAARIASESVNLTVQQLANLTTKGQDAAETVQGQMTQLAEQLHRPIVLRIAAETGKSEAQVERLLAAGDEVTNKKFAMYFTADAEDANKQMADLLIKKGVLTKEQAKIIFGADTADAKAKAQELLNIAKSAGTIKPVVRMVVNADTAKTDAREAVGKLTKDLDPAKAPIAADLDPLHKGLDQASLDLQRWADRNQTYATINVKVNSGGSGGLNFSSPSTAFRPTKSVAYGGILGFAEGGLAGPVVESPGPARIYTPTAPGRFFAEPVTGGEAYIPMAASNRARSAAILGEVARSFGMALVKSPAQLAMMSSAGQITTGVRRYAEGGFDNWPWAGGMGVLSRPASSYGSSTQTTNHSVSLSAPVTVTVQASPGMDEGQLASLVGQRVDAALSRAAKEIRNRRMVWQAG